MQIDVSFQNWQRLTGLLENERDTLDKVIERLLADHLALQGKRGARGGQIAHELAWKGVSLPNGSLLRATFKGKTYFAEIMEGRWFDREGGARRTSPSQAAKVITGCATNGWLFWEIQRPGETGWTRLDALRPAGSMQRPRRAA
jgi:hypothetical protein